MNGCDGWARVADGLFEFTLEGFKVLSAPQVTHQMLRALRGMLRRAHEEQWSQEKTWETAEAISPGFGGLFAVGSWSPEVKAASIAAIIAMIIFLITFFKENDEDNNTQVINNYYINPEVFFDVSSGLPVKRVLGGDADKHIARALAARRTPAPPDFNPQREAAPVPKPNPRR